MIAAKTQVPAQRAKGMLVLAGALAALVSASSFAGQAAAGQPYCVTCNEPHAVYQCQVDSGAIVVGSAALQLYCIEQLARSGGHESCSVKRQATTACAGEPRQLVYSGPAAPAPPLAIRTPAVTPDSARPGAVGARPARRDDVAAPRDGKPRNDVPVRRPQRGNRPANPDWPATTEGPVEQQQAQPLPPLRPAQERRNQGPPKTVEELAKRTAKSTKNGFEKAGDTVVKTAKNAGKAVGNVAKKVGDGVSGAAKKTWKCLSTLFGDCL